MRARRRSAPNETARGPALTKGAAAAGGRSSRVRARTSDGCSDGAEYGSGHVSGRRSGLSVTVRRGGVGPGLPAIAVFSPFLGSALPFFGERTLCRTLLGGGSSSSPSSLTPRRRDGPEVLSVPRRYGDRSGPSARSSMTSQARRARGEGELPPPLALGAAARAHPALIVKHGCAVDDVP